MVFRIVTDQPQADLSADRPSRDWKIVGLQADQAGFYGAGQ